MKTSRFYFELKTLFAVLFMAGVFIVTPHQAEAQFLQKLKNHAEKNKAGSRKACRKTCG